MEEVNVPTRVMDYQCCPVAVSVSIKLCSTGPLKINRLEHDGLVLFVEIIPSINEEKTVTLLLNMMLPKQVYGMDILSITTYIS